LREAKATKQSRFRIARGAAGSNPLAGDDE
jgi:hypothetical protein